LFVEIVNETERARVTKAPNCFLNSFLELSGIFDYYAVRAKAKTRFMYLKSCFEICQIFSVNRLVASTIERVNAKCIFSQNYI